MRARNRFAVALLSGAAIVALAFVTPLQAASAERAGEVGFDVGRTNFASNVADKSAAAVGVRGGYHFNNWFQLEGQLASSTADEQGADATLNTLFVNGVFNFKARPTIRPYVLVGAGRANLEFDLGPTSVDDNGDAFQVAAGSKFAFGQDSRMSARVEASRLRERTFDASSYYTNVMAGLTWKLGRKA